MSLFIRKDGKRKSPIAVFGFLLSLCFAGVFWMLYTVLAKPLYQHVAIGGQTQMTTMLHCVIVAAIGTGVCCLLFLLPDKRLVPAGFAFLGVFMLVFYLAAFMIQTEVRSLMLYFITLHFLAPVLVGNTTAWAVYLRIRKTPARMLASRNG